MLMGKMQSVRASSVVWLLVAGALVSGCATLNESECRSADWRTIGYEDGAQGKSAARIGEYRKACANHGIAPDLPAYQHGRDDGLRQFCRPQNGFRLGEQGLHYGGICPSHLEPEFYSAYEAGKRIYDVTTSIHHTEQRIRNKQQLLARLKHQRQARQSALLGENVTAMRRAELLAETLEIARDESSVETQVEKLRAELEHQRHFLAELNGNSFYH